MPKNRFVEPYSDNIAVDKFWIELKYGALNVAALNVQFVTLFKSSFLVKNFCQKCQF
jgi:hypothetical protein